MATKKGKRITTAKGSKSLQAKLKSEGVYLKHGYKLVTRKRKPKKKK